MPSTYTHYKFGREILEKLPRDIQETIRSHVQLFDIGLHGPDILFYYKALQKNPISSLGYQLHEETGREFFTKAADVIKKQKEQSAYLAYIYGVICHFALDVTCHGYIEHYIQTKGVTHGEIEVEFDRELLILEGKNPVKTSIIEHLVASLENAEVIYEFYPPVTKMQMKKAIKSTIFYNKLLLAPSKIKRNILLFLLKVAGKYENMQGLFMSYEKRESCLESTSKLLQYYPKAEQLAIKLLTEYKNYLNNNQSLDDIYSYTFEGIPYNGGECEKSH